MGKREERKHRRLLTVYGLLWLLIMVFIFIMSARDGDESTDISDGVLYLLFSWLIPLLPEGLAGFLIRKAAHMFEFCCLAVVSWLFAAELLEGRQARYRLALPASAAWSFLYACTDEWHQRVVPGRVGQFQDVLIDFLGSATGLLLAALLLWLRRRGQTAFSGGER